jgi:nucleoside-triphosphatase THEP1
MTQAENARKMIASLPYADGAYPDALLEALVRDLQAQGVRVAGVLQHDAARRDRSRCDMNLEDLATGTLISLSEDRGAAARGCRIDADGLVRAAFLIRSALDQGDIDLMIINKFGKIESEGGGLREVIAEAVSIGIPVVIGVPTRNLDAWKAFSGSLVDVLSPDMATVRAWIEGQLKPIKGRLGCHSFQGISHPPAS